MHQDNALGYDCMWVCSFLALRVPITCHILKKMCLILVKITLKQSSEVMFTFAQC